MAPRSLACASTSNETLAPLCSDQSDEKSTSLSEDKPQFLQSTPETRVTPVTLPPGQLDLGLDFGSHVKYNFSTAVTEVHDEEYPSLGKITAEWKRRLMKTCPVRTRHHERLVSCLDSNATNKGAVDFILITGDSGSGRSRLASSLRDTVESRGGYFLIGKFHQRQQYEPYIAFISAITDFINVVVQKGKNAVERTKETILRVIGDDKQVLIGMIPALEQILGKNDNSTRRTQSTSDSVQRFVFVLQMFLRALSTPKHPIVLLLDDLQWADPCSLDLLVNIVEKGNKGLMILGTSDANLSTDSDFSKRLKEIEGLSHVSITKLALPNLNLDGVEEAISFILGRNRDECRHLSKAVKNLTDGRPFVISEILQWLEGSGLLYVDRTTRQWTWNDDDIRQTLNTVSPSQCLSDRLQRLPRKAQDALKVASCLGSHVDKSLIEYALGYSIDDTLPKMQGVLVYDEVCDKLTFAHYELQQASYDLIPEADQQRFHLEIGRKIWRALIEKGRVDRYIFLILSLLASAKRLITRENERMSTAFLCLEAGKIAAKYSAFRTSAFYLSLGIDMVDNAGWRNDYPLTLALYNAGAEMEMILANYESSEALVTVVLTHARNELDKVQAYVTKLAILSTLERRNESLDLGIEVLQKFGESFPSKTGESKLASEMRSVRRLLKEKSDEQILRIPTIENEEKLACLQVICQMIFPAMSARSELMGFIALKAVKLTVNYGLSNFSSGAFSAYGVLCISARGDIDEGYRFGQLGLKLLEQFGSTEFLPRVYALHYGVIHSWKKPLHDAVKCLWKGAQVGALTGDIEFASLCAHSFMKVSSASSRNLSSFLRSYVDLQKTMIARRQEKFVKVCRGQVQAAHVFMGLVEYPFPLGEDVFASLQVDSVNSFYVYATRMWIAYILNDFEASSQLSSHLHLCWSTLPTISLTDAVFYSALVAVATARRNQNYRKNVAVAKKHLRLLCKWSESAPFNYAHKMFLVEAELASLLKHNAKALEKYTYAIALATQFEFTLELALANERAAQHLIRMGNKVAAEPYYSQADFFYRQWGGQAKVVRLENEISKIYDTDS